MPSNVLHRCGFGAVALIALFSMTAMPCSQFAGTTAQEERDAESICSIFAGLPDITSIGINDQVVMHMGVSAEFYRALMAEDARGDRFLRDMHGVLVDQTGGDSATVILEVDGVAVADVSTRISGGLRVRLSL